METLKFDLSKKGGKFKILNATNGGPWHKRHAPDQFRSNLEDYKAARIPYSRNHDSGYCAVYGGQYAHDISAIFPNFDADENDPNSYDFACTDESILITLEAGTETYFRLGEKIEHQIVKHAVHPPKDYAKWARICEHIIRHYNEGWANGYKLNIQYWEIWNEPDVDEEFAQYKKMWTGTNAEFYDFFEVVAKYLKKCFPSLKIGGPAAAGREDFMAEFLETMGKRNVPMDFFSWHIYSNDPKEVVAMSERVQKMLVKNGYGNVESILNEWNYVKGWIDEFVYTITQIIGMKGAAYTMAVMSAAQQAPIDMLMYYDTRPSVFCGVFDLYTYKVLKGYYPFKWYGMFYDLESEIRCETKAEDIYTLCGVSKDEKAITIITYFTDDDDADDKTVKVEFSRDCECEVYLLDEDHEAEKIATTSDFEFTMKRNSCIMLKEI